VKKNLYLRTAIQALRTVGVTRTVGHVWGTLRDYTFDWKYGTDTAAWASLADLTIDSQNSPKGVDYHPTRIKPFYKVFQTLNLPSQAGFVDFGCGKGRTLTMAADLGFSRVVGVEFSKALCEIARRNLAIYQQTNNAVAEVSVVESDAVDYEIDPADQIFYFFHPFDESVLRKVMENICRSLDRCPRKIWIVYYEPVHHKIIEYIGKSICLDKREIMSGGCLFYIYEGNETPPLGGKSTP